MYRYQNFKKSSNHEYQLEELLTCHICLCLGRNLTMCPHCSKLYCEQCIRQSLLIKQECPHCRKHIRDIKSMANCDRFVNEIKGIVENLLKYRNNYNFKCSYHDVILNYYCKQCYTPVCCECKMFGSHGDHEFVHIDKKYKEKYYDLREMLAELHVCIKEKYQCIEKFQERLKYTYGHYQYEIKEIQNLYKIYHEIYANKVKNYQSNYKLNVKKLEEKLYNLNQTKKYLKIEATKRKSSGKFSFNSYYIYRLYKTISSENESTQAIKNDFAGYYSSLSELIPSYETKTFVIDNFSYKQKKEEKVIIYSDVMELLGCEWKLKVHPNGSGSVEGKYLSIYVMMVSKSLKNKECTIKDPTTYEYYIEIVKQYSQHKDKNEDKIKSYLYNKHNEKPNNSFIREYTSSFYPGESWGYTKYIELSYLYCRGFVNVNERDSLVIRFGIRRPDYYTEYQSLCRYLENIYSYINEKYIKETNEN